MLISLYTTRATMKEIDEELINYSLAKVSTILAIAQLVPGEVFVISDK